MTSEVGSTELYGISRRLIDTLCSLSSQLVAGSSSHMLHEDLSDRATDFAGYLDGALLLCGRQRFAQSFSLLRSALDNWAADLLIMLGDRFVEHYDNATEADLADALARWSSGDLTSVCEVPRLVGKGKSKLRIVRRGLTSQDQTMVLHPMYFEAEHFDPFFGPPDEQAGFADWLDCSKARDYANDQRQRYNTIFRWGALTDSLVLNAIMDERHRIHLSVHHRFLSAFVHSHHGAHRLLATDRPAMAHATEELVLLYIAELGARYLRGFITMTERPPLVGLAFRTDLDQLISDSLDRTRHLWFLTDLPHVYDRGQELLARTARTRAFSADDAMACDAKEVGYYRNPLDRLRRMHESSHEMATGFAYINPWG